MGKWLGKAKGVLQFFGWEAFQSYILPFLSIPGTAMLGVFYSYDWFLIWIGAWVVFAAVMTGLLRVTEWRFRNTTKDKLSFAELRIAKFLSEQGQVTGIKLGVQVNSAAMFPIQCERVSMETSLGQLYPQKIPYPTTTILIPANGIGFFDDHQIEFGSNRPTNKTLEGMLSIRLNYGRPDSLSRTMDIVKKLYVKFNVHGDVEVMEWSDL